MAHITYKIVQHDGGWAYTVDGAFSETFATHPAALAAAKRAAAEQRVPGRTETSCAMASLDSVIECPIAPGCWLGRS